MVQHLRAYPSYAYDAPNGIFKNTCTTCPPSFKVGASLGPVTFARTVKNSRRCSYDAISNNRSQRSVLHRYSRMRRNASIVPRAARPHAFALSAFENGARDAIVSEADHDPACFARSRCTSQKAWHACRRVASCTVTWPAETCSSTPGIRPRSRKKTPQKLERPRISDCRVTSGTIAARTTLRPMSAGYNLIKNQNK